MILLFSQQLFAQQETKNDTTVVLPNDNYSQYRQPGHTPSPGVTIPFDADAHSGKPVLIAFGYHTMTALADSNFGKKQFRNAIALYTAAFQQNNDLGLIKHRYNLACCYTMTGNADSAFVQLFRIAVKGKYFNYAEIAAEPCFKPLHHNKQWNPLLAIIRKNAEDLTDAADASNEKGNQ